MTDVRALSLHQPYPTLVALGVKTIETRSWPTKYRGRLLIVSTLDTAVLARMWKNEETIGGYGVRWLIDRFVIFRVESPSVTRSLYLGAVVASCTLIGCVPIYRRTDGPTGIGPRLLNLEGFEWDDNGHHIGSGLTLILNDAMQDVSDQLPFGDFSTGRFAWGLDDVKPTSERCPRCWGEGRRAHDCSTCNGVGWCEPVPMRGRQGLWTPTWE